MRRLFRPLLLSLAVALFCGSAHASTSKQAKSTLEQLLLGKDVRALLDMPAYKDGIDIYESPKSEKRLDDRGIDLKEMSKYLKEKGVGVEREEWVPITELKINSDRVEVHLAGGGEGRGGSKNAAKKGAGYKRAGGSRINFRYNRELTDADLQPATFLIFLGRVLDTTRISQSVTIKAMSADDRKAIAEKKIIEGMTYQMVLLSSGEPDQKKVDDTDESTLKETWYYLKDGHRIVVRFQNGTVVKVQTF